MSRGLLDTSVVIALAQGEAVSMPEASAVSIVTLCELRYGVLAANDEQRPARLATLVLAEIEFQPLTVDARVVPHYARILSTARRQGRRPSANNVLIAATAAGHDLPVFTRDRDFLGLDGVEVVLT